MQFLMGNKLTDWLNDWLVDCISTVVICKLLYLFRFDDSASLITENLQDGTNKNL